MIDDEQDVYELIKAINEHLPMPAYATSPLVKAVRRDGAKIEVNDAVEIDSVMYLGDRVVLVVQVESGVARPLLSRRLAGGGGPPAQIGDYGSKHRSRSPDHARNMQ